MGLVSYLCLGVFDDVFNINTGVGIFMQGMMSGVIGIILGLTVLYLIKNEQLLDLIKVISRKFRKKRILAPEQVDL